MSDPQPSIRFEVGRAVLLVTLLLVVAAGCRPQPGAQDGPRPEMASKADRLARELRSLDPVSWVRAYDPARSAGGYNLVLFHRRLPAILDMNGRVVHWWPEVRASGRARLGADGRLTVISTENAVEEYAWDGRQTLEYRLPGPEDLLHHDFIWLRNGNLLLLAKDPLSGDYLLEVTRDGREVWRWQFKDHRQAFPGWDDSRSDPTHANSVFELEGNRWFAGGDRRFRPGNILVSARNLSTVLVIDRETGDVVWMFSRGLDNQHEASMIASDEPGEGTILLFDNGLEDLHRYRRSRVLAVDPISGAAIWSYRSQWFFSAVGGTAQALPGGNVLIASSRGGRVMEVTHNGDIVWELVPPYLPMRPLRVASDHCPQLAALTPVEPVPVAPPPDQPYIDVGLYRFGLPQEFQTAVIAGRSRDVLNVQTDCRALWIPPGASLDVGFGILPPEDSESSTVAGRFRLELRRGEGPDTLVDVEVAADGEAWVETPSIELEGLAYSRLRMCLAAEVTVGEDEAAGRLVWSQPRIESEVLRPAESRKAWSPGERELAVQRRQLEALGYVE